jgi:putative endonuclease
MRKETDNFFVYILECGDGTLYTGWTNAPAKRLAAHNDGKGARYTRGRGPVKMVFLEQHETKTAAMQREAAIKKLRRRKKMALIHDSQTESLCPDLS